MPGAASAEGCLLLSHARERPSKLPDHESTKRGIDPQRVFDCDVDNLVCELGDVAGAQVVPPPVRKRWTNIAWWTRKGLGTHRSSTGDPNSLRGFTTCSPSSTVPA